MDSLTGRRRWVVAALALGGLALIAAALYRPALGVRAIEGQAGAPTPESSAELEQRWDAILDGAVDAEGGVRYPLLRARRASVGRLLGTLSSFGPRSRPAAFPDRAARFAYFINAYNALVVAGVLELDVRRSVREVRGWFTPREGMGFFWGLRFEVDGERTNLHALENDVLRARFGDARLHAAINCASASCPRLAASAYHGASLEAELDAAARRLASAPHVRVVGASLELSSIFAWYRADFEADAEDGTLLGWIAERSADEEVAEAARAEGVSVRFVDYDWSLNEAR